jgi:hypothetical protein
LPSPLPAIETKVLEVRDRGTFIPVLAIRNQGVNDIQRYYFRRCGFPADGSSITLMCLYDQKATNDPYEWEALGKGRRTLPVAHEYILKYFADLQDGEVVDVEVVLQEKETPKVSERLTVPL